MNLANARTWIRRFARNAMSSTMYPDEDLDRALMVVGQDFCNETHALRALGVYTLNPDDASIVITPASLSLASGTPVEPENLIDLIVSDDGKPIPVLDFPQYTRLVAENGSTLTGRPRAASIPATNDNPASPGSGFSVQFWPSQDSTSRSLFARLWLPFPVWTPGADASGITSLGLPDHWLMPILTKGAPAVLQANEPEHKYTAAAWAEYEKFRNAKRGAGSLGVRVAERAMQE